MTLERTDALAESANEKMFAIFKKQFMAAFRKFSPEGRAEVELGTNSHRPSIPGSSNRNEISKKSIKIKCYFDGKNLEGTARPVDISHQELSAGQKAILSICIILGLQKCGSPTFYCFDEIDADLDPRSCQVLRQMYVKL